MTKLLLAVFVAWLGWFLWVGPKKYRGGSVTGNPDKPARPVDSGKAFNLSLELAQARAVLGVSADADENEIRAAHRRLVSAVHPDKGGSTELTRRVNEAREILLRRSN
jgi:hypothetical protein